MNLNRRQLCDLELLLNGAFAPLNRFLNQRETESVLQNYRLPDGTFCPLPIFLDAFDLEGIEEGKPLVLCDGDGTHLARLAVDEIWEPNKRALAGEIFGTTDEKHPGVAQLLHETGNFFIGGNLEKIREPRHYDFLDLRHSPRQFRARLAEKKVKRLVGFNTRNPLHRVHYELTRQAMESVDGDLLIQPVVGVTCPGDVDYVTRVKCYQSVLKYYPAGQVHLSLLPLAMRMAGPREALLHGIIRRNYGCTHFIVGRDQVSPGPDGNGRPFYPPYAAQELFQKYEKEIGLKMVAFPEMTHEGRKISGTALRRALEEGSEIPEGYCFPEVLSILKKSFPKKSDRGLAIFFTGLPGSGKSTVSNFLAGLLRERLDRQVTVLDGDLARRHLSKGLGFSKEDRDTNIRRIGFVAAEIARHGGIVIAAAIAPYAAIRGENRRRVQGARANVVEVYLSTPLSVCESRDVKGHYAGARKGLLKNFTGVDDPYEAPCDAEIVLDTAVVSAQDAALRIFDHCVRENYLVEKNHV